MDPTEDHPDPVVACLTVPLWRRRFGLGVVVALALVLAGLALAETGTPRRLGLALAMLGALLLARALWGASGGAVVLRASGRLETGAGRSLALPEDIAAVETGTFAFRPSNGFLVRLRTPGAPGMAPGLWWRLGRRLGIGGLADAAEIKAMAAALAARRPPRDRDGRT